MFPLFSMFFIELDVTWGVFLKATMEQACRIGARYGITNAVPDPNHPDLCSTGMSLTDCVKEHVQWAAGAAPGASGPLSGGLLGGANCFNTMIAVQYYAPNNAGGLTEVTGAANANSGGNVIMVSVNNYPLTTLLPPFPGGETSNAAGTFWVTSADTMSSVLTPPTP